VFAVLRSKRSGVHVQAVVPATGSSTIDRTRAVAAAAYVAHLVVN
jgi:hypothetical protein